MSIKELFQTTYVEEKFCAKGRFSIWTKNEKEDL